MAYILHIDTSAETGIVALASKGRLIGCIEQSDARNHAANINLDIDRLLRDSGVAMGSISSFCVNGGPGSYTGLRIGLATAKGFCYALDKPLMMHNRLLLLCLDPIYDASVRAEAYVSILQARAGEYFIAAYDKTQKTLKEPQHLFEKDLEDFAAPLPATLCCSGYTDDTITTAMTKKEVILRAGLMTNPESWARYGWEQFNRHEFVSLANSEPFYLKQPFTHNTKIIN